MLQKHKLSTTMPFELEKLLAVNADLETEQSLSRQDLLARGIIRESLEPVHRVGITEGPKQSLPFSRLVLPFAFTGVLEPSKAVTDIHQAIHILLPGAGSTFSVAETLCDVAGTFHGRKSKNRGRARQSDKIESEAGLPSDDFFRAASFPMDLPLTGMGVNAPFEFAGCEGLVAVIRHVHLVLSHLYPDRPVFLSGRSQGGIASLIYAQSYDDVAGVVAVNPPHPDPELFQFTIDFMESKADDLANLLHAPGVSLASDSWEAYKSFTPGLNYPDRKLLSPALVLVSLGDPFNLFPRYTEMLQVFADQDSLCRLKVFDAGHNLWDRRITDTYHSVIGLQTSFMVNQAEAA